MPPGAPSEYATLPFTPLHFGYGALIHAAAPRRISFLAFCAVNVAIDLEPLYYMTTGQYPLHRFFHTLPGAGLAAATVLAAHAVLRLPAIAARLPDVLAWKSIAPRNALLGVLVGAVTHVVLDAVMHADLRPLSPVSDANPFLGLVAIDQLNFSCLLAASCAAALLGFRRLARGAGRAS